MKEVMSFYDIIKEIQFAIINNVGIEIYYSQTENNKEGWRKIKPDNITTDIPPEGEVLVVDKDRLSPGHILNAHDLGDNNKEKKSFIIGKIKLVRKI